MIIENYSLLENSKGVLYILEDLSYRILIFIHYLKGMKDSNKNHVVII